MARRRYRRKDLRRPDEFVNRGNQVIVWVRGNTRLVSQAGGVGLAVVLVVGGIFSVRSARARQANDDLTQALAEFRAGHYSQAAIQLGQVASRWQSTPAGNVAALYAANADLKAGNAAAATELLQSALPAANTWPPYLRQQALLALAYALERKGDTTGAVGHFNEAAGLEGPYTSAAILGEARCREQAGEKDAARKLYERFVREFPQAAEVEIGNSKVAALQAPG